MKVTIRLAALVVLASLVGGPLSSIAQAQQQPPALMEPQLKTTRAGDEQTVIGDETKAALVNVFRVPGKGIICGLGGVLAVGVLFLTFGTQYHAANAVLDEGCGGKWVVDPSDMRRDRDLSRAFDWETHRFDWEPSR